MPAEKNVGEPCAGEPHARFDGGREETSDSRLRRATLGASRLPDQPRSRGAGGLWEACNKLIQRQEHGGAKEGESVTWRDARRVVFLMMFLMLEFVETLEDARVAAVPPPAHLE